MLVVWQQGGKSGEVEGGTPHAAATSRRTLGDCCAGSHTEVGASNRALVMWVHQG